MTLIEPIILVGAAIGGVTGAVWGAGSGIGWAVAGFFGGVVLGPLALMLPLLVLALSMTLFKEGPRAMLRSFRGKQQ
ncbi:hypothetical protein D7X55_17315 [Corallococcus sp. AB049A]|uniref:hypothetical protein n=1 Tax=Corallococcus sp. AB049A TaxID=2316721 RepID=UPI000ED9E00B|nr:hypothetical protein [Corallococcus sp. AB049A]RKI64865.1 hypothetical protein D7X55_17315 [Corallococcus sp. AB049A]